MNCKKQGIIELLEKEGTKSFPQEIAEELKLNRSTVRNYLRDLAKNGHIVRLPEGRYCSKGTYGVLNPLELHNARLHCNADFLRDWEKIEDVIEEYGDVKILVIFGKYNGQITVNISNSKGMNRDTVVLAFSRARRTVKEKTGFEIKSFVVTTIEANRDFVGKRLDNRYGLRCFTVGQFEGFLERIYQREPNVVRVETKCSRPMSEDELFASLRQGSLEYVKNSEVVYRQNERIEALTKAIKFLNARIVGVENSQEGLLRNQINLTQRFVEFKGLMEKNVEALNRNSEGLMKNFQALQTLIGWKEEAKAEGAKKAERYRS